MKKVIKLFLNIESALTYKIIEQYINHRPKTILAIIYRIPKFFVAIKTNDEITVSTVYSII